MNLTCLFKLICMANITGTIGNNSLIGSDADDNILGLAGNDTIKPGLGDDTVDGGDGKDTLVLDYSTASGYIYYDYSVSDTAKGTGRIHASYYNDLSFQNIEVYNITGSEYGDHLWGGNFSDTLNGGNGDDTIHGGSGADVLDGGFGIDLLFKDLSNATANLVFDNTGTVMNFSDGTVAKNFEEIAVSLGYGNDTIKLRMDGKHSVDGRSGIDTLVLNYSTLSKVVLVTIPLMVVRETIVLQVGWGTIPSMVVWEKI
jgi:Ca2+-binding RTX toxin-like protein